MQPKVSTSWSAPDGSLPRFHLINRILVCGQSQRSMVYSISGQSLFMFVNRAVQWHYIDKLSNDTVPNHTFITTNHKALCLFYNRNTVNAIALFIIHTGNTVLLRRNTSSKYLIGVVVPHRTSERTMKGYKEVRIVTSLSTLLCSLYK